MSGSLCCEHEGSAYCVCWLVACAVGSVACVRELGIVCTHLFCRPVPPSGA